jgi:type I restriction enzyme M protein
MTQEVISIPDGFISDYIDGKLRKDTPEEYVRQNIEKRLVDEHGYSKKQIAVEFPVKLGSGKKRADIAIFQESDDHLQENIEIIIECKQEKVESSNKNEGIDQLKSYMSGCLNCQWGMWTNGKTKFVFQKLSSTDGKLIFGEPNDIPSKGRDVSEIDRPTRDSLKLATDDNLLYGFKTCHNHIYVNDGLQKQQAFFEFLKLIFCKILDERNIPNKLEFYASSKEKLSPDGQLTVKNRIGKIYDKVKKRYPNIFPKNDAINLKSISLSYIVSEIQKYSFLDTYIDVKGRAYEEIVGANLRGDRGEFFTPRNIAKMTISMLDIPLDAKILDPACGTGGFLVIGMNEIIKKLNSQMKKETQKNPNEWSESQKQQLREKIHEIASQNFFGFDINPDLVKSTKMNMVMNNDGSGNILQCNSLNPPHQWPDKLKESLEISNDLEKGSIRRESDIALFDIVVTNPPFGTKLPIKDTNILEQYDLGHIWRKDPDTGKIFKTEKLTTSRPPEVLFIERCLQFLKSGGIMGIVLPDAILGAPGIEYASVREWIIQKCKIIASIDLHADTFQPKNGTQTSVLILQKKTDQEIETQNTSKNIEDYGIFFAMVNKIGHDKRGSPIYKRDAEGNEILSVNKLGNHKNLTSSRLLDDETPQIAKTFLDWKKEKKFE